MKEKFPVTRAVHFLKQQGIVFEGHLYRYEGRSNVAQTAAAALGIPEEQVYKTLVFQSEGKPLLILVDAAHTVAPGKLTAALGAKRKVEPCEPRDAERFTGYQVGGISPFGTRTPLPVFIDECALRHEIIYVNGGSHGFMIALNPNELVRVLKATTADITA